MMIRAPWRSLRARVVLITGAVACAAVATVGWYSTRLSVRALDRQLRGDAPFDLDALGRRMNASLAQSSDLRALRDVARQAHDVGRQLALFDSTRTLVWVMPDSLRTHGVTMDSAGSLMWQADAPLQATSSSGERTLRKRRILVENPRRVQLRASDGRLVASLVEIPMAATQWPANALPAVASLRRSLMVGIVVAIVGALLIAAILSRWLVAPLEQLTESARAIAARPDPAQSKPVRVGGSTEVGELAAAFNTMLAELARADSLRRGMTTDIAHELRTPLTNIRCHIESLQDGIEQPTSSMLASLHDEVLVLQRLVDDLQELTLAEQGRLRLDVTPVDVVRELTVAVRPFGPRAAALGVELTLSPESDLPPVLMDPGRFRQIVTNIVTNALTHARAGGSVNIDVFREDPAYVTVRVRDDGSGIHADDLPNVFERFYRADPARARATGGAGLGLAIVRQLVTMLGGTVAIRSEPGVGTAVWFTCPVATSAAASPPLISR